MKTYTTRDEMEPKLVQTLTQMMESHAYRELAAAQMFGYGLQFVPRLKWLRFLLWHAKEEMDHYALVVGMYQRFTGESVEPKVNARLSTKPIGFPGSWFELAMAQFLYDRGGLWQLRDYEQCAFLPYREVIAEIVAEEVGHQSFGERIVVELCQSGDFEDVKQRHFEAWLRQGMLSFGRPGTEGNRYAIESGLKQRDSGEVMQAFLDSIKPAMKASGLTFPDPKMMGIVVPASCDFSLDGTPEVVRDATAGGSFCSAPTLA